MFPRRDQGAAWTAPALLAPPRWKIHRPPEAWAGGCLAVFHCFVVANIALLRLEFHKVAIGSYRGRQAQGRHQGAEERAQPLHPRGRHRRDSARSRAATLLPPGARARRPAPSHHGFLARAKPGGQPRQLRPAAARGGGVGVCGGGAVVRGRSPATARFMPANERHARADRRSPGLARRRPANASAARRQRRWRHRPRTAARRRARQASPWCQRLACTE